MAQFQNHGDGVLFPNSRKRGPNSPDMTGSITVNGVEYFASAWNKQNRQGGTRISISIGDVKNANAEQGYRLAPQPQGGNYSAPPQQNVPPHPGPQQGVDDFNDDIPF